MTEGSDRPDDEPDVRFSYANERTFLAWIRTALALVAAGLAIVQLLPPFHGIRWGRHAIGIPLILLGAVVAVYSYLEWHANQRALRRGEPAKVAEKLHAIFLRRDLRDASNSIAGTAQKTRAA